MANAVDPYFMLIYTYSDDYMDRRVGYRKQHIEMVEDFVEKGYLILGGATDSPPDGAYLCFQCPERSVVEDFVNRDPYVLNGLVLEHEIRDWKVVVGTACGNPVRSSDL